MSYDWRYIGCFLPQSNDEPVVDAVLISRAQLARWLFQYDRRVRDLVTERCGLPYDAERPVEDNRLRNLVGQALWDEGHPLRHEAERMADRHFRWALKEFGEDVDRVSVVTQEEGE